MAAKGARTVIPQHIDGGVRGPRCIAAVESRKRRTFGNRNPLKVSTRQLHFAASVSVEVNRVES
jgi:hypothetical protein